MTQDEDAVRAFMDRENGWTVVPLYMSSRIPAPAQAVGMREALIEQCAKIAEPWSGFLTGDKMGAMDRAIAEVRQGIADAIRSIAAQPPAAPVETKDSAMAKLAGATTAPVLITSHASEGLPSSDAAGAGAVQRSSADTWDVECERIEKDFYAKVGRYCTFGPPAERKRQWIILFEDADKGMMIFDDEREAHTAWDRAKDNWTCTLYETAHRKFVFAAGQLRPLIEPQTAGMTGALKRADEALNQMMIWMPSGFAPQSQDNAMRLAREARNEIAALALSRPELGGGK